MAASPAVIGLVMQKIADHEPDLRDKIFSLGPSQELERALLERALLARALLDRALLARALLERADEQLGAARRETANSWQWRRGAFTETERAKLDDVLRSAAAAAELAGLEDLAREVALHGTKIANHGKAMSNRQLDNILKNTGELVGAVAAHIGTTQHTGGRRARRTRARRPCVRRGVKACMRVPDARAATRRARPHTQRQTRRRTQRQTRRQTRRQTQRRTRA